MTETQDNASQKLQRGHKILNSGPDDSEMLGLAVLRLHAAIEDRLRELLAARSPKKRLDILDVQTYNWVNILEDARSQLGLSQADADFLARANTCRNEFAHGGSFPWSRKQVLEYEELIQRLWATGSRHPTSAPSFPTMPGAQRPYQPARPAAQADPVTSLRSGTGAAWPASQTPAYQPEHRAWHRSVTIRGVLYLTLVVVLLLAAGAFLWNRLDVPGYFSNATVTPTATDRPAAPAPVRTTPAPTSTAAPTQEETSQPATEAPTAGPAFACQMEWMEYPGEDLERMNRSMVWSEVVSPQVQGSGMTPNQFYQMVVDMNPFLVADGYEFRPDKTYLLPRCSQ